jgi:hypothetical protein
MNYTDTEILRLQKRLSFIKKCFRALAYDLSKMLITLQSYI